MLRGGERVLGIETSGMSGSVALLEGDAIVSFREHREPNQHAEQIFSLIEEALEEAGWDRRSLTKIAVSRGPGAFTAIRIGMAVGDGLSLGLGIPAVTVNSLEALALTPFLELGASGPSIEERELRVALRDARREEYFVSIFDRSGGVVFGPSAVEIVSVREELLAWIGSKSAYFIGEPARSLGFMGDLPPEFSRADPDARAVALLGATKAPEAHLRPEYVRGPNVIKPNLPPSPFALPS